MFTKSTYLVRERVAVLKLTDTYDILEADTGQQVAVAQEKVNPFVKMLRFVVSKQMLPMSVAIAPEANGAPVVSLHRGFTLLRSKVKVRTGDGKEVGYFQSKYFSFGGAFRVFDQAGKQFAEVKGDWKGWNFKFTQADGVELGTVTKKWAGLAKELFTSADNYVINLAPGQPQEAVMLLLAAGIAIDTVYNEN